MKGKKWLKTAAAFVCLGAYVGASLTILIESAIDGDNSSKQSDIITGQVQDAIDKNYDKNALKDIEDFNISFSEDIENHPFFAGDALTYSIGYKPVDTSYKTLDWNISNPKVLDVDQTNQTITFLEPGVSEITITSDHKSTLSKTFSLVCNKIEVESISASIDKNVLNVGDSTFVSATVVPDNASDKAVLFETQDPDILEVNPNSGDVKALAAGDAEIIVTSVDKPSISTSVSVHVNPIEDPTFNVESISLIDPKTYLNYNSTSITVKGTYTNPAAKFDPKLFQVSLKGGEGLVSVGTAASSSLGNFSFKINLTNKEATRASDFVQQTIEVSASYDGISSQALNILVKPIRSITIDDVAKNSTAKEFHYITLENPSMGGKTFAETVSISVPFVSGFSAKDCFQNNFAYEWIQDDGSPFPSGLFANPTQKFNSFSMTFKGSPASLPISGKVVYYPDKNQKDPEHCAEFPFSYSAVSDSSVIRSFSYKHLSATETAPTEFYVGQTYTNQSSNDLSEHPEITYFKELFLTQIVVDYDSKTSSAVKNALGNASLTAEITAEDGLLESKVANGKITSIKFLKEGLAKITLSSNLIASRYDFFLKGTAKPNDFTFYVNNEAYDGKTLTIDQGEVATFAVQGHFLTQLEAGQTLLSPADDFSCRLELPSGQQSLVMTEEGLAVQGVRKSQSGEPIAVSVIVSARGVDVRTFTIDIGVSYVPVTSNAFSLSLALLDSPNEFNKGKDDGSVIPLGSTVQASVTLPDEVTNKKVTFTSSNPDVVSVDINGGLATALATGEAEIRATSQDNPSVFATKKIKVIDTVSPFTLDIDKMKLPSCDISKDKDGNVTGYVASLDYGSSYAIFVHTNLPSTSSNLTFAYAEGSSSPHAVKVDKAGNVSTVGVGEDNILITYGNGLQSYSMRITFKVAKNYRFTWSQLTLIVRKSLGHYLLFAVTALFSVGFLFFFFDKKLPRFMGLFASSVLGFALAGFSELIQVYTPGRSGKWADVGIDTAGYLTTIVLALLLYALVLFVRCLIKRNKKEKDENKEKE